MIDILPAKSAVKRERERERERERSAATSCYCHSHMHACSMYHDLFVEPPERSHCVYVALFERPFGGCFALHGIHRSPQVTMHLTSNTIAIANG